MKPPLQTSESESIVASALKLLRQDRRRQITRVLLSVFAWISGISVLIIAISTRQSKTDIPLERITYSLVCAIVSAFIWMRGRRERLEQIRSIRDVRLIGPLLDAHAVAIGERSRFLARLLTELLPLVSEEHVGLLSPGQRNVLNNALLLGDFDKDAEFLIAILHTQAHIGDESALSLVRRVAETDLAPGMENKVSLAARAFVPQMETRIARRKSTVGLLIPSQVNDIPGSGLLRPLPEQDLRKECLDLLRASVEHGKE